METAERPAVASLALAVAAGIPPLLLCAVAAAWPEASPLSPDHAGGERGWAALFLAAAGAAFALYLAALAALRGRAASLRAVVALACAVQLVPLAGPVLLSTDVYTYWARARVGVAHDGNPYRDPPSRYEGDPALERMGASWRDRPTGYGPAFTLLSEGEALAAGESAAGAAWPYRLGAAAAMVALTLLAASLGRSPSFAAAFVGWNPLLALHLAGGGHSDALMMALVLGALALAARGRHLAAGGSWALAVGLKWVPLLWLPLVVCASRRSPRSPSLASFALVSAGLAAVACWRWGTEWLHAFSSFSGQLERTTSLALPSRLAALGLPERAAIWLCAAAFGIAYLWLLAAAWRGRPRLGLAAGLLLVSTSWLVPWYAVWAVSLAAWEEDRLARGLALGLSAYLLRGAVPL